MANVKGRIKGSDNDHVMRFESWDDFVEAASTPSDTWTDSYVSSRNTDERGGWYGTPSFAAARKLALNGWQEGREQIAKLTRNLEVRLLSRIVREDVNYDVEGMAFDVARYLEGEPEHWARLEESTMQADSHKHVRIVMNTIVSGGVTTDVMIARGSVIAALVELLEYAGTRVELWAGFGARIRAGGRYDLQVRVKAYDQPLDMARVAFALAHPSMSRRMGFALIEHAPAHLEKYLHGGYGAPEFELDAQDASLYISGACVYDAQWRTPELAEVWLVAELARLGVVLRDEE